MQTPGILKQILQILSAINLVTLCPRINGIVFWIVESVIDKVSQTSLTSLLSFIPLFLCSCSKFPSFNQTMEEADHWTQFAPIAKLESLDEIDQDNSKHSNVGIADTQPPVPTAASPASASISPGGGGVERNVESSSQGGGPGPGAKWTVLKALKIEKVLKWIQIIRGSRSETTKRVNNRIKKLRRSRRRSDCKCVLSYALDWFSSLLRRCPTADGTENEDVLVKKVQVVLFSLWLHGVLVVGGCGQRKLWCVWSIWRDKGWVGGGSVSSSLRRLECSMLTFVVAFAKFIYKVQ